MERELLTHAALPVLTVHVTQCQESCIYPAYPTGWWSQWQICQYIQEISKENEVTRFECIMHQQASLQALVGLCTCISRSLCRRQQVSFLALVGLFPCISRSLYMLTDASFLDVGIPDDINCFSMLDVLLQICRLHPNNCAWPSARLLC